MLIPNSFNMRMACAGCSLFFLLRCHDGAQNGKLSSASARVIMKELFFKKFSRTTLSNKAHRLAISFTVCAKPCRFFRHRSSTNSIPICSPTAGHRLCKESSSACPQPMSNGNRRVHGLRRRSLSIITKLLERLHLCDAVV
jgi:hypothetical protein